MRICAQQDDAYRAERERKRQLIIDAAPDTYAALKELYEALDSCVELTFQTMLKARAAIAKAEGR